MPLDEKKLKDFIITKRLTIRNNIFQINNELKKEVIYKWAPILDQLKKRRSNINMSLNVQIKLFVYMEVIAMYDFYQKNNYNSNNNYEQINIEEEVSKVFSHMIPNIRSKIVDKYYNYETGLTEYLLEDGNFVPINESVKPLNIRDCVFPEEFYCLFNKQEWRDFQINKILEE